MIKKANYKELEMYNKGWLKCGLLRKVIVFSQEFFPESLKTDKTKLLISRANNGT